VAENQELYYELVGTKTALFGDMISRVSVVRTQIPPVNKEEANSLVQPAGSLNELPSRVVVQYLNQQQFTGYLLLHHRERRKKIWFSKGQILRIQSNLIPELLGRMMVDRQWINEADLRTCLDFQKDLAKAKKVARPIGQLVQEIHGLDTDEVEALVEQQRVQSMLQALTWSSGTYEYARADVPEKSSPHLDYSKVVQSLKDLLDTGASSLNGVFDQVELWSPKLRTTDLSKTPLWSILAASRKSGLSGIISVRRQNRLFEIVLKHGIPLTFYEGTFGQPRQTIVVRRASEEHEKFFVEQIFKLLSFLTGTVSFRPLETEVQEEAVQADNGDQFKDETAVTKSVNPAELLQASTNKLRLWFAHLNRSIHSLGAQLRTRLLRLINHFKKR